VVATAVANTTRMKRESESVETDALTLVQLREALFGVDEIFAHIMSDGEEIIDAQGLPALAKYLRGWATTSRTTYVALLTNKNLWDTLARRLADGVHMPLGDFTLGKMPLTSLMRLYLLGTKDVTRWDWFDKTLGPVITTLVKTFCPAAADPLPDHKKGLAKTARKVFSNLVDKLAKMDCPVWAVNERLWHITDPVELMLLLAVLAIGPQEDAAAIAPELDDLFSDIRSYSGYPEYLHDDEDDRARLKIKRDADRGHFLTLYDGYKQSTNLVAYVGVEIREETQNDLDEAISNIQQVDTTATIVVVADMPLSYDIFWYLLQQIARKKLLKRSFAKHKRRMFHAPCAICRTPTELFERAIHTPLCSPQCQDAYHRPRP